MCAPSEKREGSVANIHVFSSIVCINMENIWDYFHFNTLSLHQNWHMIITIDKKTGCMDVYPSLLFMCKARKDCSYSVLKNKQLSEQPITYKGVWLYKVFKGNV